MLGDITVQKYALDRSLRDRKRKIRWEMVPKGIEGWHPPPLLRHSPT